ncbi:MAG: zinc ribbon domain-containing protein [Chloroflexota bacterium]
MRVSVWPEYDEPRVLVIYEGEFADAEPFPSEVSFRLPPGAEINQVCALTATNEHLCQMYDLVRDDNGITLTYTLPVPRFFVEFYYNPIEGTGHRSIPYEFTPLSAVDSLTLEIQEPARAADFVLTPGSTATQQDASGFKYHTYNFANVAADAPVKVDIGYAKADANPSVPKQQGARADGPAGAGSSDNLGLIAGFGVLAVFGAVGFATFNLRRSRQTKRPEGRIMTKPAGVVPNPPPGSGARAATPVLYCTSCGEHVGPVARFCPGCGEPVRR